MPAKVSAGVTVAVDTSCVSRTDPLLALVLLKLMPEDPS
jgi:hypothetical protein